MLTRKIGKLIRGKATPTQLMLGCILGSILGFIPGFAQGAGLIVLCVVLIAVLNVNLFLAAITGLAAKVISVIVMPVTFLVGHALLDGPAGGLFAWLINAPVLALFGFEYYLTTGGLVMGAIVGVIFGVLVIRAITAYRTKMASFQEGSTRYQKWAAKWYVRVFTFVFVGGGGKKQYKKLLTRRVGNPIRPIGAIAAALLLALIWVAGQFFSEPIVTAALQRGLERANGATVDIQSSELSFREGRLALHGFAMTDVNNLRTDLVRADRIEAAVSSRDLLRKRMALDEVVLVNASSGEERRIPGRVIGRRPEPTPDDPNITLPDEKTLEEYIEQAQVWKERLAQLRQWIERISGPEEVLEEDPDKRRESLRERLDRQIRESGYAWVRADHLVDDAPTFIVYKLDAEHMRTQYFEGATVDLRCRNLSTHPHLSQEPPSIRLESSDDRLLAAISLDHVIDATRTSSLEFVIRGIEVDAIASHFAIAGRQPISGGTLDVEASGTYGSDGPGWIEMPLKTTVNNTTLALGSEEQRVDQFILPIGVRGPMDQPRIMIDDELLLDALVQAGAARLAGELESRLGDRLDDIRDRVPGLDRAPGGEGIGDALREGAGGLFGGRQNRESRDNNY